MEHGNAPSPPVLLSALILLTAAAARGQETAGRSPRARPTHPIGSNLGARGVASASLRLVLAMIAGVIGSKLADCPTSVQLDDNCGLPEFAEGALVGAGIAMVIDAALSFDGPRVSRPPQHASSFTPTLTVAGAGVAWQGRF
jgi:hypothetical protein